MIVFASAVTRPEIFSRYAEAGFRSVAGPDDEVIAQPATGSIFQTYNAILERARELPELEALVLAHQDCEIVDPGFGAKIRSAFADSDVAVVGCVGAIGVRSIAWWEGSVTWASFIHRYSELGGGDFESLTWDPEDLPPYGRQGEVDTVDGLIMVLSPWAVDNVTFDESLDVRLHGYDLDLCLQVREAGRTVLVSDLRVIHHHSLDLVDDPAPYVDAHVKMAEKWDGRVPGVGFAPGDWRERARQAEAEAAAIRAQARAWQLQIDVRVRRHRHALAEMTTSTSWRLTAPIRLADRLRRRERGQRG